MFGAYRFILAAFVALSHFGVVVAGFNPGQWNSRILSGSVPAHLPALRFRPAAGVGGKSAFLGRGSGQCDPPAPELQFASGNSNAHRAVLFVGV
jgi:hypothetical protein